MRVLAAVVLFGMTWPAANASATSIDIRFTATDGGGIVGSNTIDAAPGDTLTAMISIAPDALGVSIYGVSLIFDMDLGNELKLISATELLNAPFQFNADPGCASTQDSSGATVGKVLTCEATTLGEGPTAPQIVNIIEVVFQATGNVASDGFDIETGLLNVGFDGVFDNASDTVIPIYGKAAVNLLPEPHGLPVISVGLIVTVRARRRS